MKLLDYSKYFNERNPLAVLVDAGSRYEVNYTGGLTHFLQKMAFQVIFFSGNKWSVVWCH